MRSISLAICAGLLCTTSAMTASAEPQYYTEVQTILGATNCAPYSSSAVPGCTALCHTSDPDTSSAYPSPSGNAQAFCSALMNNFGWTTYASHQASGLDQPLEAMLKDQSYANAIAIVKNGCGDPTAAMPANGGAPTIPLPEYGCDVAGVGVARGASALVVSVLGLLAFAGRKRRSRL